MKKGFTLLELIIVIIIVGTLATLALPQYFRVVERARTAEATRLLGMLRDAQIRYYAEKSVFADGDPLTDIGLDIDFTATKFFTMAVHNVAYDGTDPIVSATRDITRQLPFGYGAYQLTILVDGTTNCVDSAESECGRLGY